MSKSQELDVSPGNALSKRHHIFAKIVSKWMHRHGNYAKQRYPGM